MPEEIQNQAVQTTNNSVLNKPVPNPLAKNPNFFTHKVFAAIGLILIGTIAVLFGLALIYHVNLAELFNTKTSEDNTKVSTSSAKPKTATDSAIPSDWKTYKTNNYTYNIEIKYPSDWSQTLEGPGDITFYGPNKKDDLPRIQMNGGEGYSEEDQYNSQIVGSDIKESTTTVADYEAKKVTSILYEKVSNGKVLATNLQHTYVQFSKGKELYWFELQYEAKEKDLAIEKIFDNMLLSFKLL